MLVIFAEPAVARHIASNDHDPFTQVTPRLWRGPAPDEQELEGLASRGVKTVIDLRILPSKLEERTAKRLGMQYLNLPMGYFAPSPDSVATFLKIVSDDAKTPVFVHCRQGADRTGTLIAIYRRLVQNWTYEAAYEEMRTYRTVNPHAVLQWTSRSEDPYL
jgi:protein tyrosine/serine phosphatase